MTTRATAGTVTKEVTAEALWPTTTVTTMAAAMAMAALIKNKMQLSQ